MEMAGMHRSAAGDLPLSGAFSVGQEKERPGRTDPGRAPASRSDLPRHGN